MNTATNLASAKIQPPAILKNSGRVLMTLTIGGSIATKITAHAAAIADSAKRRTGIARE